MSNSYQWRLGRLSDRHYTIFGPDGRAVAAALGGSHENPFLPDEIKQHAEIMAAAPDLLIELQRMCLAYVRLLENARSLLVMNGTDCDPVDKMEADDQNLVAAKAAIAKAIGGAA